MDEKLKKRPWFQFHLSTAVVLMFVASGLLWLNMRSWTWESEFPPPGIGGKFRQVTRVECRGFPFPYQLPEYFEGPVTKQILLDAFIALVILVAVCRFCEWLIRRKAAQAEPPKEGRP